MNVLAAHGYLRSLFDQAQIAILIADDDASYVDANERACLLLGGTRSQIVGRNMADFIALEMADIVKAQWHAFIRDGAQSGVFEVRRLDGTSQLVAFHATASFEPGLHCSFMIPLSNVQLNNDRPFLTLCAWTKRVFHEGLWISIEEFLTRKLNVHITHGISPSAAKRFFGSEMLSPK